MLIAASHVGILGGHDLLLVAVVGLIAGIFCTVTALRAHSRRAGIGAAMSALPIVVLADYLMTSEG